MRKASSIKFADMQNDDVQLFRIIQNISQNGSLQAKVLDLDDNNGFDALNLDLEPIEEENIVSEQQLHLRDFHPDEPLPPKDFVFSTYTENLRSLLNVFIKRKIKEPLVQHHRKIVAHVYKQEHQSYDQQFEEEYWLGEQPEEIDFQQILNCEYRKLVQAPHVSKNYQTRKDDHQMQHFDSNPIFQKVISQYCPVDEEQATKYYGTLPPVLAMQLNTIATKRLDLLQQDSSTSKSQLKSPIKYFKQTKGSPSMRKQKQQSIHQSLQNLPLQKIHKAQKNQDETTQVIQLKPEESKNLTEIKSKGDNDKIQYDLNNCPSKTDERIKKQKSIRKQIQIQPPQQNQQLSISIQQQLQISPYLKPEIVQTPLRSQIERLFHNKLKQEKQKADHKQSFKQFPLVKFDKKEIAQIAVETDQTTYIPPSSSKSTQQGLPPRYKTKSIMIPPTSSSTPNDFKQEPAIPISGSSLMQEYQVIKNQFKNTNIASINKHYLYHQRNSPLEFSNNKSGGVVFSDTIQSINQIDKNKKTVSRRIQSVLLENEDKFFRGTGCESFSTSSFNKLVKEQQYQLQISNKRQEPTNDLIMMRPQMKNKDNSLFGVLFLNTNKKVGDSNKQTSNQVFALPKIDKF